MLKFSTIILIAILIYHGLQYYNQWQMRKSVENYRLSKVATKLKKADQVNGSIPEQGIIKISEKVYIATGYGLANSILLIGKTGIIIVDTTESFEMAKKINEEFRKITDKPLKGIIYTHNHVDHVLGSKAFIGNNSNTEDLEIWAHHTLMSIYQHGANSVGMAHYVRSMHQFGGFLSDEEVSGVGYKARLRLGPSDDSVIVPPNKLLYTKEKDIALAGISIRLLHIPGETDDQIAVFWPEEKILLCGDDFYRAFPNLYAIRGTLFRSLKQWYESLDTMRNLRAEVLISSHAQPVIGAENVFNTLTDYRDAIQIVHDQTVRFINKGMHPDEIAEKVRLPESLKEKSYLQELYGTVRWSSKGLFSGYMGWFSGDIVELNPHVPDEQAKRLVKLAGGIDNLLNNAKESLENDDPQWALRLSSAALRFNPTNSLAKELKVKSLFDLAALQTSMNGYNYYVTSAYVTLDPTHIKISERLKGRMVRRSTMKELFSLLSMRFKMEECQNINKVITFIFPDTRQQITFHVRNGIMDLSGTYSRSADVKVTINSVSWRQILLGERSGLLSALSSELSVEPSVASLQEIMNCIDRTS